MGKKLNAVSLQIFMVFPKHFTVVFLLLIINFTVIFLMILVYRVIKYSTWF